MNAYDDIKDKYHYVFEKIFKNMGHHEHFKMMMGIADEAGSTQAVDSSQDVEVAGN